MLQSKCAQCKSLIRKTLKSQRADQWRRPGSQAGWGGWRVSWLQGWSLSSQPSVYCCCHLSHCNTHSHTDEDMYGTEQYKHNDRTHTQIQAQKSQVGGDDRSSTSYDRTCHHVLAHTTFFRLPPPSSSHSPHYIFEIFWPGGARHFWNLLHCWFVCWMVQICLTKCFWV